MNFSKYILAFIPMLLTSLWLPAQPGTVKGYVKISASEGNFLAQIQGNDNLGSGIATPQDLDRDGITDLIVGAPGDDDGSTSSDYGAVYVLGLNPNSTVKAYQKISKTAGNFQGFMSNDDEMGHSIAVLGDVNQDGYTDIAVSVHRHDDGGTDKGAVWIMFLDQTGQVIEEKLLSRNQGNFGTQIPRYDNSGWMGKGLGEIGDFDGDGIPDLAIGQPRCDDNKNASGAIHLVYLTNEGTAKEVKTISNSNGNLKQGIGDPLDVNFQFGTEIAAMGDMDGNGVIDLAVGAPGIPDGGNTYHGGLFILFMNADGTVLKSQRISETFGNFSNGPLPILDDNDFFGNGLDCIGDLDGDGIKDLVVGAPRDDDGQTDAGAVYILFLNADGTVKSHQKISLSTGGLPNILSQEDYFGYEIEALPDMNGDGIRDIAVGAPNDQDGGPTAGAFYILFLDGVASTSIGAELAERGLQAYPNPASDRLYLESDRAQQIEQIALFDLYGRMVWEEKGTRLFAAERKTIPLQNLEPGIYTLRIGNKTDFATKKIWVRR